MTSNIDKLTGKVTQTSVTASRPIDTTITIRLRLTLYSMLSKTRDISISSGGTSAVTNYSTSDDVSMVIALTVTPTESSTQIYKIKQM